MQKIKYEPLAKKASGLLAIYIKCSQFNKSLLIDTNIRIFPDEWDKSNSLIINNRNSKKLNLVIRKTIYELEEFEFSYENDINIHTIKKIWKLKSIAADFYKIIEENIPNREIRDRTKQIHFHTFRFLQEYEPMCQVTDLTEDYVKGFYIFLKNHVWHEDRNLKESTINIHMEVLRTYYNLAKKLFGNKVPLGSFGWYNYKPDNSVIRSITEDDIRVLENYTAKKSSIVVDQFLFLCYTGMRYSDFVSLSENNITIENGKMWITYTSVKTNVPVRLPLSALFNSRAEQILYKYWDKLLVFFSPGDNSTWNRKLNRLSRLSGLGKHITAHMARHTCATRLLQKGVAITTIQKVVGHRKLDTTMGYAKVTDANLALELAV